MNHRDREEVSNLRATGFQTLKPRYCGGGLVAGEVVAGSVGRVGGVSPGTTVPPEFAGGRVSGGSAGATDGAVAAESVVASVTGVAVVAPPDPNRP